MHIDLNKTEPLAEFLLLSAPIARSLGKIHCHETMKKNGGCNGSYHGIWHYLRLMDIVASPLRSTDFYLDQLSALARAGDYSKVMISGAADYAMLALVVEAYQRESAVLKPYQLDICTTPLLMGDWYADQLGIARPVSLSDDILNVSFSQKLDVICTHSFIAQFEPSVRPELLASWRNILRPGGVVVTCLRIDPGATGERVQSTPAQVEIFTDMVRAKMEELSLYVDDDFLNDVAHFSATRISYPFRSAEQMSRMFHDGGFSVRDLQIIKKEGMSKIDGPVVKKTALYAHIVAQKI